MPYLLPSSWEVCLQQGYILSCKQEAGQLMYFIEYKRIFSKTPGHSIVVYRDHNKISPILHFPKAPFVKMENDFPSFHCLFVTEWKTIFLKVKNNNSLTVENHFPFIRDATFSFLFLFFIAFHPSSPLYFHFPFFPQFSCKETNKINFFDNCVFL